MEREAIRNKYLVQEIASSLTYVALGVVARLILVDYSQINTLLKAQLLGLMYNNNQIRTLQQELFKGCPFLGQILTVVGVDAHNGIYPVAYDIVKAEIKAYWCWFLNLLGKDLGIEANVSYTFISDRQKHIHENMKSQFKRGMYTARATTVTEWRLFISSNWHYRDECVFNMDRRVCSCMKLETWAHVYSFKINPCNGREMWLVVESRTVIIPPIHKPQVCRPPKKRKGSVNELASQSCSSEKLSRKFKSVKCSYKAQGGASQASGSSQQSQEARQAAGVRNVSSQAVGSSQSQRQVVGVRNDLNQAREAWRGGITKPHAKAAMA
uniref:Transposase, mutator type n=1 Tax=Tanacetum cinerariifolium TaxID=118510 RepID=A0A6L2NZV6_TANCI|nr:transposase, mutator type [Tanacetum cinerariifolium]